MTNEMKQSIKANMISWAKAIGVISAMCLLMFTESFADGAAIRSQITSMTDSSSWIQLILVVGSLISGCILIFGFHKIMMGVGVIGGVWGMLGLYNAGALISLT